MSEDKKQELSFILYTNTKMVNVDPAVLRERRIITGLKGDPRADIFRILRTNVLRQMRENNWTSLAITSATSGAGKSFVTANLAVALAMVVNQTVLAIDADLRRPKLASQFGIKPKYGLFDYLTDDVPLADILINPGFQRLVLLPGRGTTNQSSEFLSSPKMLDLVHELKTRYDSRLLIFDMPPLLPTDDTMLFMPQFDAVLFVVADGGDTPDDIKSSMRILQDANLLGTVLNKSNKAVSGDYYYTRAIPS